MISRITNKVGTHGSHPNSGEHPQYLTVAKQGNAARSVRNDGPSDIEQFVALRLLTDAYKFANNCGKSPWDFAIEIGELLDQNVCRSLLRWLVCQNLVEHRLEAHKCCDSRRQFCEAPNLVFNDLSCFVVSPNGVAVFAELDSMNLQDLSSGNEAQPVAVPVWCPETRVLKINGKVVKHFKWPAPNQEKLIAAFAAGSWPKILPDPLPPNHVCPKRRLHDTIKCLNRNQINKLIKFRGDGTGQGVFWEARQQAVE